MAIVGTPTPGNDIISGDAANNFIDALAGNDSVNGNGGNDSLIGGLGNDTLLGAVGDDTLIGGEGNDNLGGDIFGGEGNDSLSGGAGDDILNGGSGRDTLAGGAGNDIYAIGSLNTIIVEQANEGNDDIVNSGITYTLGANLERLTLTGTANINGTGNAANNIILGNSGNNVLSGLAGDDAFNGNAGNDTLRGGLGNDNLAGGNGIDQVVESGNFNFTLTNTRLTGNGTDSLNSIESVSLTGGAGNNVINAAGFSAGNVRLNGLEGNDTLTGGLGNDILAGSTTNLVGERDILTGGTGADLFVMGDGTQVFYDDLNTTTAGSTDYALVTDFNTSADVIQLNGRRDDYVLARSPVGLPTGTAIYLNKLGSEPDELIAIVQGSTGLSLNDNYFKFTAEFNLADLDGNNGFTIDGGNYSGYSVSNAGDVNGDGFDDIIIGNPIPQAGESYVVFGKSGGFGANFNLSTLNGSNGFQINGIDANDFSGRSVSGAGDVNGDGFDDIIIGTRFPNNIVPDNAAESYVVFGKSGGFGANLNLSTLNGSNGFTINGTNVDDFSESSVSGAGDVNGDGLDDIIIGSFGVSLNGQYDVGESYVVFGSSAGFGANLNVSTLNGSNGFKINGIDADDFLGDSVSGAGDVNGDGFDDIIIGADGADANGQYRAGESYVVFGSSAGFGANLNLSALNGSNGFKISGINAGDRSGDSVSGAGDVNGDGFDDIIIGSYDIIVNGQSSGESYVVFGSSGGFGANLNLSALNGTNGFQINGIDANDFSDSSVSGAGDVNGDGFDDILIGATLADESYVIFGRADFTSATLNVGTLEPFDQLLASNNGNAMMSKGQNFPFGSTNTTDNSFFDLHKAGLSPLLVGTDITHMIT